MTERASILGSMGKLAFLMACAVLMVGSAAPAAAQGEQDATTLRYVRAGKDGAIARNVYSKQGVPILEIEKDTILAVHGERSGWLQVEAPGGFRVWVYGQYVEPGKEAGTLRITGNGVRMRPLPSSGPESLMLRETLSRGDQVRFLRYDDPGKALAESWVQVYSPPGARAWVRAEETVSLAAGEQGASLWAESVRKASARPKADVGSKPVEAAAGKGLATTESRQAAEALKQADAVLAAERKKEEQGGMPDYSAARAAYEQVLALGEGGESGSTADLARGRLKLVDSYVTAYQLKGELESRREGLDDALARREEEMDKARKRDTLDGRFERRGWLEERTVPGFEESVWVLRWAGADIAEVTCSTGRYDLTAFRNFELGLNGRILPGAVEASVGGPLLPRIDIASIDVLSGRLGR